MARPLRIEYPGAIYHVTSRGNARSDIYLSDTDRELFLGVLHLVVEKVSDTFSRSLTSRSYVKSVASIMKVHCHFAQIAGSPFRQEEA